ncbi:MAG: hypothetical protein LBC47_05010, partial [Tannerella sp.]|nr:hypothetical protein [Tannerella sp.]
LYEAYKNSIEGSTATGIAVKNTNAPVFSILQPVLTASEFNYYIVGYDPKLFSNISISDTGEMTYTIAASAIADDKSYINIIFARK